MFIFLSFDFDADSAEQYYYHDQIVKMSKARFSINVGLQRVLKLLKNYGIKTTFFTPGWVVENYPGSVKMIINDGHELASHGYRHEKLNELSYEEEYNVHKKAVNILKQVQGFVYGFRRPYWEITRNTFAILAQLGVLYDSSLMDSDEPYVFNVNGRTMVELPVYDIYDDWILFEIEHRSPKDVLNMWIYELKAALEEELSYFCLILHPACIGRASRIRILDEFIRFALDRKCRFASGYEIAQKELRKSKKALQ